jgi:transposase-like protein
MTNGSPEPLIIAPARDGHRRSFSEADKRRIVEQAVQPGASLSEVARRYGIAARVLFRPGRKPAQVQFAGRATPSYMKANGLCRCMYPVSSCSM